MSKDLSTKARQQGNERNDFICWLGKEKRRGKANKVNENDFHSFFSIVVLLLAAQDSYSILWIDITGSRPYSCATHGPPKGYAPLINALISPFAE